MDINEWNDKRLLQKRTISDTTDGPGRNETEKNNMQFYMYYLNYWALFYTAFFTIQKHRKHYHIKKTKLFRKKPAKNFKTRKIQKLAYEKIALLLYKFVAY